MSYFSRWVFIVVMAAGMLALQGPVAADVVFGRPAMSSDLGKRQQERKQQHEQTYRDSRELPGVFSMRDVCRLRSDRNQWTVTSMAALKAKNEQVRIKIKGHNGHAVLQTTGRRFFGGKLTEFNLTLANFNDPKYVQVTTTVSVQYGALAVTRTHESLNGFQTIALHQGHLMNDDFELGGRGGVALTISHHGEDGEPSVLQFGGADLAELRRAHPREVERHLRPMLRQVGIESILAADATTARQVFSHELAPDPEVVKALGEILPALDGASAAQRDTAMAALREQGPAMALAVAHLDRRGLSDQQNTLLDAAISPHYPYASADVRRLRDDVEFLIDCLHSEEAEVRAAALQRLRARLEREVTFELDAPADRRAEMIEAIRAGVRPATQPSTQAATQPAKMATTPSKD